MIYSKEFLNKFKQDIENICEGLDFNKKLKLYEWGFEEYKNMMMIPRNAFKKTLLLCIKEDCTTKQEKDFFKFLYNEIDGYGMPKVYLITFHELYNQYKNMGK